MDPTEMVLLALPLCGWIHKEVAFGLREGVLTPLRKVFKPLMLVWTVVKLTKSVEAGPVGPLGPVGPVNPVKPRKPVGPVGPVTFENPVGPVSPPGSP